MEKTDEEVASQLLRFCDFIPPHPGCCGAFYSYPVAVKKVSSPCVVEVAGCTPLLIVRRGSEPEDLRTLLAFLQ